MTRVWTVYLSRDRMGFRAGCLFEGWSVGRRKVRSCHGWTSQFDQIRQALSPDLNDRTSKKVRCTSHSLIHWITSSRFPRQASKLEAGLGASNVQAMGMGIGRKRHGAGWRNNELVDDIDVARLCDLLVHIGSHTPGSRSLGLALAHRSRAFEGKALEHLVSQQRLYTGLRWSISTRFNRGWASFKLRRWEAG
jgi:hypothetical protein